MDKALELEAQNVTCSANKYLQSSGSFSFEPKMGVHDGGHSEFWDKTGPENDPGDNYDEISRNKDNNAFPF